MTNDGYERIERLLLTAERHMARVFLAAVQAMREQLDLNAVADLLARQDYSAAADMMMRVAEDLGAASNAIFVNAGQSTATFLRDAGVATIAFDQVNHRAVESMRANTLRMVREFTEGQRATVQQVIVDTMAQGLHPRVQARRFREAVGLTQRQWQAVSRFRALLEGDEDRVPDSAALTRALRDKRSDRAVAAAIRDKRPLDPKHIDRMVARYVKRYIAHRAVTIARTESLRSVHQGVEQAYSQAIEGGHIVAAQIEQKWVSAGDARVRDSHQHLNGQIRAWGESWQGYYGNLRFPGDPTAPAAETINCFPGDVLIAPAGTKRVVARHYSGKLAQLALANGVNLPVTPNHPVLTQRGWVAAGDVVEGDKLLYSEGLNGHASTHPQVGDGLANAQSLADFAKFAGHIDRPVAAAVNFHGERPDHQVEVVTPPRELRDHWQSTGAQLFGQFGFTHADVLPGALLFLCMSSEAFVRPTAPGYRVMGWLSQCLARESIHAAHAYGIGLGNAASNKTQIVQAAIDHAASHAEFGGNGGDGVPLGVQLAHALMVLRASASVPLAHKFAPVEVRGVGNIWHSGPVFNFETDTGLIASNGVLSHNCRCAVTRRIKRREQLAFPL